MPRLVPTRAIAQPQHAAALHCAQRPSHKPAPAPQPIASAPAPVAYACAIRSAPSARNTRIDQRPLDQPTLALLDLPSPVLDQEE